MKVENFVKHSNGEKTRVSATVIWENRDRPNAEVFFETTAEFKDDLVINPNSWLLACTLPAMRYGESRIKLDAPISPETKDGLVNAIRCLIDWHGGERKTIAIEAPTQSEIFAPKVNRAAGFFSGDIDTLAMVRENQLNFPPEHPRHIQDGIVVGNIFTGENTFDSNLQQEIEHLSAIAKDAKLQLIPVFTNAYTHLKDLDPDYSFWQLEYMGAFLAAIAHVFAPRLSIASIASTLNYAYLEPWGSHPLLDPLYSCNSLEIRHENTALSFRDKVKLVGQWDVALQNLRVCDLPDSKLKNYNCGRCDRCLKTMTALLSLGLLKQAPLFLKKDVSQELIVNHCSISNTKESNSYRELIEPLQKIGRHDLADGINQVIAKHHQKNLAKRGLKPKFSLDALLKLIKKSNK